MYIDKEGNRFNPYATIVINDVTYPGNILSFPEVVSAAGITEISDPERKDERYYIVTEQDTAPYVVNTPRDIEVVKEAIWEQIKDKRELLQVSGMQVGNYWYPNDVKSRTQWERMRTKSQHLLNTGSAPEAPYEISGVQVSWKTMTNDFVPLTLGLIVEITDAFEVQESTIFYTSVQKDIQMRELQTVDDLADWVTNELHTGWPAVYEGDN